MAEINMGVEESDGEMAQALQEIEKCARIKHSPKGAEVTFPQCEEPCLTAFQEIQCDTIADVRVYLFGMRDVIGNNPDNDYQQGQLNVIEKLLDATAG